MGEIWNGFVSALEWVLTLCFELTGNAGLAIIVFTLAVKIILLPITMRQLRSSREMQELQPKLRELQKKYAKDREKLNQAQMELYREHGVNPMMGCLPSLLQLPIFFGVYYAVLNLSRFPSTGVLLSRWAGFSSSVFLGLSSQMPASIWEGLKVGILAKEPFLWMPTIGQPDAWHLLPILAGVFQLIQQRMMTPARRQGQSSDPQQAAMNNSMMFMPLMIVMIGWSFPAGPVIYWVAQSVFGIIQQYFISGWGALADWLPFLPEREPQPAKPQKKAPSVDQGKPARRGFFDRLMEQMISMQEQVSDQQEPTEAKDSPAQEAEEAALPPPPQKRRSSR
ncbi:MAG: membrane protein insertase YidC [Chloroflexia bacterium]|nr:membrane protein insertase YidC [Chloroflexia bacterium]